MRLLYCVAVFYIFFVKRHVHTAFHCVATIDRSFSIIDKFGSIQTDTDMWFAVTHAGIWRIFPSAINLFSATLFASVLPHVGRLSVS